MTTERRDWALAAGEEFAAYGDSSLCAGIWASALEQHRSQAAGSASSRAVLESGFGSVLAAGGSVLYDTADLIIRIDTANPSSRKQDDIFRREISRLLEKAEMFERVSTLEERREIMGAWQRERPHDMLPELDILFHTAFTSLLDSAIGDAFSRSRRMVWAKSMEQAAWHLRRSGSGTA